MLKMKYLQPLLIFVLVALAGYAHAEFKKGDKLQTIVNLHPDPNRMVVYTLNYQLDDMLIPVCSDITITKVKSKEISFDWQGREFTLEWEKHTKGAGFSVMDIAQSFFGQSCDKTKIDSMSKLDQDGIREGRAKVGMTRAGVLIAMGPPPKHANPNLDTNSYMYWVNRFGKRAVDFDDKGIVVKVR